MLNTIRSEIKPTHTRCHYNSSGKVKMVFDSELSAQEYIVKYKLVNKQPYICKYCEKWHIGRKK